MSEYAVPMLPSRDLHESLAFYERLGFENVGDAPDVWEYMIIRRGGIELHFFRDPDVTSSPGCFAWVDDVDALHREWRAAGVDVVEPADTEFGVRMLSVTDPSGNQVLFGTGPH